MSDIIKINENNWETRILRFTGFTVPENQILKTGVWETWWELITGNKPENRINNLREGLVIDSGKFENGILKLEVRQSRVDILYENSVNPHSVQLPSIGEFSIEAQKFDEQVVKKMLTSTEIVFSRIAFGAIFYKPTSLIEDAFMTLSKYVTCIDFDKIAKNPDFEYRVNRTRSFGIEGLQVNANRLMKWNAQVLQIIYMINNKMKMQEIPGAYVEIDINTQIQDDLNLNTTSAISIFNTFVNMGIEISEKGDVQ